MRIQRELAGLYGTSLSVATIHRALSRSHVKPLRVQRGKAHHKRYARPIPGERVQMDTCEIGPGLYQDTAVDDCTRYRGLALFQRPTAANTLEFIDSETMSMNHTDEPSAGDPIARPCHSLAKRSDADAACVCIGRRYLLGAAPDEIQYLSCVICIVNSRPRHLTRRYEKQACHSDTKTRQ